MPENIANQPFVMGHGPSCTSNIRPPTPASPAHPQARIQTTISPSLRNYSSRSATTGSTRVARRAGM